MSSQRLRLRFLRLLVREGLIGGAAASAIACGGSAPSATTGEPLQIAIAAPPAKSSKKPSEKVEVPTAKRRPEKPLWQPANANGRRGCTVERPIEARWAHPTFTSCPNTLYRASADDSSIPEAVKSPYPPGFNPSTAAPLSIPLTKEARSHGSADACCYEDYDYGMVEGRPLVREGTRTTAPVVPGARLGAVTDADLGAFFLRAAADEHASVAAFADVTLQLMALGAPLELLSDASRAMRDEVRHAERCYRAASRLLGRHLQPGALPAAVSIVPQTVGQLVTASFLDGCVGETVAARAARARASVIPDESTRAMLLEIAEDEERHAEFAWRIVGWALRVDAHAATAALTEVVAQLRANAARHAASAAVEGDPLLSATELRALVEETITEIALPCAETLLNEYPAG